MIDPRGTTIRLPEELMAEAQRAAKSRKESFTRFVAWTIRQALRFEFLSPGNREFVLDVAVELGRPWDVLAVLNLLVSYARGEARARKLLDLFLASNDSFRSNPNRDESQALPVDQAVIDFSQKQPAAAAGEASPSPKRSEPSPAHPIARKAANCG